MIPLKSITGQKLTSVARATIQVKIRKRNVRHTFQKVQGLPKSAILGIDFLENHKVLLDFNQRTLYVKGCVVPLERRTKDSQNKPNPCYMVNTTHDIKLLPRTQMSH